MASASNSVLTDASAYDMLDRMTNRVYHYDLTGQQKSVKGKALSQLDRDFDACARFNERKSEERPPRRSGNYSRLSVPSVVSVVYQTDTYNLLATTTVNGASTNVFYAIKDHLNTVHALVDASGTIAASYTYDAWGNVQCSVTGAQCPANNRFLFQGREYFYATGLYNFRARWYNPEWGRWLSKDPIGLEGGLNLYVAFANNPVMYSDPMGRSIFNKIDPLASHRK